MIAGRYDLTVWQGSTLYVPFAIEEPNGTVIDPPNEGSGYTIGRMTIRDQYGGDELLSLTTSNGGMVLGLFTDADGWQWSGYILAAASATALLVPWGDGVYDLEISDSVRVEKVLFGKARLAQEATI